MIFSGGQFLAGVAAEAWASDVGLRGAPFPGAEAEPLEPEFLLVASHVVVDGVFLEVLFFAVCRFGIVVDRWAAEEEGVDSGFAAGELVPFCPWGACELGGEVNPGCCVDWGGATLSCAPRLVE